MFRFKLETVNYNITNYNFNKLKLNQFNYKYVSFLFIYKILKIKPAGLKFILFETFTDLNSIKKELLNVSWLFKIKIFHWRRFGQRSRLVLFAMLN